MLRRRGNIFVIIILILAAIAFAFIFSGCFGGDEEEEETKTEKIVEDEDEKEKEKEEDEAAIECYYCGMDEEEAEEYEMLSRPFVVTVGNSINERPHSGLSKACVVYELEVEGNETRFLAVFNKLIPGRIGNIRSARHDFVTLARENDAYYVHIGGSPGGLSKVRELGLANLDEFSNAAPFIRSDDRIAPNNAYIDMEIAKDTADSLGYRKEGERSKFQDFRSEDKDISGEDAEKVQVSYGSRNIVTYEYDAKKEAYLRSVNDNYHEDESMDEIIKATNIIIQYADSRVIDNVGRMDINIIGSGDGKFISQGKVKSITWEKEDIESPTKFYNEDREEIELYPGQTWINIVPGSDIVTIEN